MALKSANDKRFMNNENEKNPADNIKIVLKCLPMFFFHFRQFFD